MGLIATFDGGYERVGVISADTGTCHVCSNVTDVISMDNSEEEYRPGNICKECVIKAIG